MTVGLLHFLLRPITKNGPIKYFTYDKKMLFLVINEGFLAGIPGAEPEDFRNGGSYV